jgi:hypothetical protein
MSQDRLTVPHDWKRIGMMLAAFAIGLTITALAFYQLIRAS